MIEQFRDVRGLHPLLDNQTVTFCLGVPRDFSGFDYKHSIKVFKYRGCDRVGQVGATALGIVCKMAYVARSCVCNSMNALVSRHGVTQPAIRRQLEMPDHFARSVAASYIDFDFRWYDAWIEKWPVKKRAQIAHSIRFDLVRGDKVKSFPKREVDSSPLTRARLIQGYANLSTQEFCGREHYAFQKTITAVSYFYELFPGITGSIASGLNSDGIADWMEEAMARCRRPFFYERDGKSWDATMQKMHHDVKVSLMRSCSPRLASFVDRCFYVKGSVVSRDGFLAYTLYGTVKSGHNDTTSGNSLINMLIAANAMHICGYLGHILVAGDDAIVVVDGDFDINKLSAAEADFGIIPKARKLTSVYDVTFISGRFWPAEDGRLLFSMILGRMLARLWWSVHPPGKRDFSNYRHSVCAGLKQTCEHLPIYSTFLSIHDVAAKVIPVDKVRFSPYVVNTRIPDRRAVLELMGLKYRVPVHDLVAFEGLLADLPTSPAFFSHPVVDAILSADLAGLEDRPLTDFHVLTG